MDRLSGRRRAAIVCRDVEGLGGTTTTILEHARRLCAGGWDVDVFGWRLDREAIVRAGAVPRWVPGWPWGSTFKRRFFAFLADRAVARGYDIIHGHGDNFHQHILSLHNCVHAAHEAIHGRPLASEAGVAGIHARQLREKKFKIVVANSELMCADMIRRWGVPRDKIRVIYPGFDPKRFNVSDKERWRGPTRRELGFADSDAVFGLITSGDFEKRGVGVFLDAVRGVPSVKALVMGKERLGPYLRAAPANVRFLPAARDVERFYHALDVYVHPAYYEEFGQSVQEALACGLPVLTNERVGAAELIRGEARRFVLPKTDARGLRQQIEALTAEPAIMRLLAGLGPASVKDNDWGSNFQKTHSLYEALVSDGKKR